MGYHSSGVVTVGESVTAPAPAPEPCVRLSPHTAPQSDSLCHRYPSHDLRELHIFSGCFLVVAVPMENLKVT